MPSKSKRTRPSPSRAVTKKSPTSSRRQPNSKAAVSPKTTRPSRLSPSKKAPPARIPAVRSRRKIPQGATVPKPVAKKSLPISRPPQSVATVSADAVRIQEALDLLSRAQEEMTARGVDLLAVAHELGRNAAQALKVSLVESLVKDQLLTDLQLLRLHCCSGASTPPEFQHLAEATLNWFTRHFGLEEYLEANQLLEVPASDLDQYDFDGSIPEDGRFLVQVQVQVPGWKCRNQIIIPPRVALAVTKPESTGKPQKTEPPNNPF